MRDKFGVRENGGQHRKGVEAEAGRLNVQGQPEQCNKTLFQKKEFKRGCGHSSEVKTPALPEDSPGFNPYC